MWVIGVHPPCGGISILAEITLPDTLKAQGRTLVAGKTFVYLYGLWIQGVDFYTARIIFFDPQEAQ